jgi:hypothetical protein
MPYTYIARVSATAFTTGVTLIQVKAGSAAPVEILECGISQITKTTAEIWRVAALRKTGAATVTSFTPLKMESTQPAALAVGGTAATGHTASAEGTDGDILHEDHWNIMGGSWLWLPIPEERIWVPPAGIFALKNFTTPAASTVLTAWVKFREIQG